MEVRERNSFTGSRKKATSGEGGDGTDRPEGEALGLLPFTQLKDCAFLSPLQIPQTGPELQGNYGNAALKPSIAFFQFFLRTKQRQYRLFFFKFYYAPSSIKHVSAPNMCMFPTFSSPQLFDICGDAFKNGCKKENYGDFVSVFFLAAPEKKSCSSLHHVNLPIKRLQRRTAQGVGL